jgi:phage FluMu protein Com
MKVIKDNYKRFPEEVTCKKCGSVILLEGGGDVYRAENSWTTTWQCPLCKECNEFEINVP